MRRSIVSIVLAFLLGCASDVAPNDPALCDPAARFPDDVAAASPSPDGEGWCCRAGGPPLGGACAHTGGWVADPCDCGRPGVPGIGSPCDTASCAWRPYTDEHGCERYDVDLTSACAAR